MAGDFTIVVDGRAITARDGQTVAAAMTAAGVAVLRHTRRRRNPRGVFCGIGVCFDCLVTLNGRDGVRACLITARDGDTVDTRGGDRAV